MGLYKCYYGIGLLKPSSIYDFDKYEGSRVYTHINSPSHEPEKSNIWLKTYGLKDFMIECLTSDLDKIIKRFKLKPNSEE